MATLNTIRAGSRKPEAGSRKPEARSQNRAVYGLSVQSLLQAGTLVPRAVVLAHDNELRRLAATVPEAVPAAVVAGDPCFDRLLISSAARRTYRAALGAEETTTVVFVSSTWGPHSLFGRFPALIPQLLAELDLDDHIVCAALHPNTWFAHGPAQIALWLADCLRAGLRLVPPARGWQQSLIAADVVVGDHGAVTGYAAALGHPTVLATFPEDEVVAESAIGVLGRAAPRLDLRLPLPPQLQAAIRAANTYRDDVLDLVTSVPGESARLLRRAFYTIMELAEPDTAPIRPAYPVADLDPIRDDVRAWRAHVDQTGETVLRLRRRPADVTSSAALSEPGDHHLVVASDHPRHDLYGLAAVVLVPPHGPDAAAVFDDRPACRLVVRRQAPDLCRITSRHGRAAVVRSTRTDLLEAAAAALHSVLVAPAGPPARLTVMVGPHAVPLTITRE